MPLGHRGGRAVDVPVFNLRPVWGRMVKTMPRLPHSWERHAVLILQEAGWVSGQVWTAVEDFVTTGNKPRWSYFVDWNLSSKICGNTCLVMMLITYK